MLQKHKRWSGIFFSVLGRYGLFKSSIGAEKIEKIARFLHSTKQIADFNSKLKCVPNDFKQHFILLQSRMAASFEVPLPSDCSTSLRYTI